MKAIVIDLPGAESCMGLGEVGVTRPAENGSPAELLVDTGSADAGAINRALVEAGCEVSAVVPERANLHAVFESILHEHAASLERSAT